MQFGHALQQILQRMYDADPYHGPIYMIKVDIAGGFYRVGLAPEDVPSLRVYLPPGPDGKNLVAFPPSTSDGLGGIPTTVLCCHGNRGGPCQHSIEACWFGWLALVTDGYHPPEGTPGPHCH